MPGSIDDFTAIAAHGGTIYIVSEAYIQTADGSHTSAVVWRSADGVAWESLGSKDMFNLGECYEGCPSIGSLAAAPAGVLFSGGRDLWFSADGIAWERLEGEAGAMDRGQIAAWAGGFARIGTTEGGPAIWLSVDGHHWTEPRLLPAPGDLAAGEQIHASRIATSDQRLVVLGSRCQAEPDQDCPSLAWTSDDAVTWSVGPIPGEPYPEFIGTSQGGFIVVGTVDGQWTAWTSSDGATWTQRSSTGLPTTAQTKFSDGVEFSDLVAGPAGAILVASDSPDQALWFSEAP